MCNIYGFVKGFDTLSQNLLITKLGAYELDTKALYYIKSYLDNRKKRVCVNSNFSSLQEIIVGVPQGSILGPLLFNIFVNDLYLFVSNSKLSNYADDNTLYASGYNLEEVNLEVLMNDLNKVTEQFYENYIVLNAEICHFMCLGKNGGNETFIFKDTIMNNSKKQKIQGVTIDNKLTFSSHIRELY